MPATPHAPRSLFAGLVDDAALFPPGNAPMAQGLAEHAQHRSAWYADLVGPFLCPVTRVDELLATLPREQTVALSLVVDATGEPTHHALRAVTADARVTLAGVEAPLARLGDDAATVGANLRRLPGVTGYLEVPRRGLADGLGLVADGTWHAAKYRTGGTAPDAFPSEGELAAFLVGCAGRTPALPFKLTAGLHHAVRHTGDGTGFEHHGLLNVLVATAAAARGAAADEVAGLLAERQARPLTDAVSSWSPADADAVRRVFRSFGCCGVTDPIDDLLQLGLLDKEADR